MFDKLIVSEPAGSGVKNRRSYFMVSSLVVGVLFLAAVVFSIYAADFGLGKENFELSMLMTPPEIASSEPQPQKQLPQPSQSVTREVKQIRTVDMPRVEEIGPVPTEISTAPNTTPARPTGDFEIGETNVNAETGNPKGNTGTEPAEVKLPEPVAPKPEPKSEPVKPEAPKPPPVISGGVVNGTAKNLPTPLYPAIAKQMGIAGLVQVQVLIDESGKVISANAVNGNSLLKPAAEKAAWGARFSPTYLTGVAVKVNGIIVYNFKK